MGIFDVLLKKLESAHHTIATEPVKKLTRADEARIMVERITDDDMKQFSLSPYRLNTPIRKCICEHGHPFAFMDLDNENQQIAKSEMQKINVPISVSASLSKLIPKNIEIPIRNIVFQPYSPNCGYTRLICTPYTLTGKISKYPLSLSFMTRMGENANETTGEFFYGKDGGILKASVNIWNNGVGFFYELKATDQILQLSQIKTTSKLNEKGLPSTIYKTN